MKQQTEKRYRLFMSWDYEREEAWLNEMSEKGLHFQKASLLSSSFERNDSKRYTYRLDYQTGIQKGAKFQEYIDLYQDAGWEYVSSYGSMWFYFRREWQPGEPPQLYTDRDSLVVLYKKIQRMMGIMLLVNLVVLLGNMMNLIPRLHDHRWWIVLPVLGIYMFIFGLLGYGYTRMGSKINRLLK